MEDVDHVLIPDELAAVLEGIAQKFPEIASAIEGGIRLKNLSLQEQTAFGFLKIPSLINEVINNINLVLSDLEMLSLSPKVFKDNYPLRRYKLLMRNFFYEFARFEDCFGYYTSCLQQLGYMTKASRRHSRKLFYDQIEDMVKIRNIFLHGEPYWGSSVPEHLILLESLDFFDLEVRDKAGNKLEWGEHLTPACFRMKTAFYDITCAMRDVWNKLLADFVRCLINNGKLEPLRDFVPKKRVRKPTRTHV